MRTSRNRIAGLLLLGFAVFIVLPASAIAGEEWRVTLNPPLNSQSAIIKNTPDGHFYRFYKWHEYVGGTEYIHHYLTRITSDGAIDWDIYFEANPGVGDMFLDTLGNVYLPGISWSLTDPGCLIRKYSPDGVLLFNTFYPQPSGWGNPTYSVSNIDPGGNILFIGTVGVIHGLCTNTLGWLGGGSPSGARTWSRILGAPGTPVGWITTRGHDDYGGSLLSYLLHVEICADDSCKYIPGCIEIDETHTLKIDSDGNTDGQLTLGDPYTLKLYPSGCTYENQNGSSQVTRRNSSLGTDWSVTLPGYFTRAVENKQDSSVLMISGSYSGAVPQVYLNSDGSVRWERQLGVYNNCMIGPDGYIYAVVGSDLKKFSAATGGEVHSEPLLLAGSIDCIDSDGGVYISAGPTDFAKYTLGNYITIRDANNDSLPNVEFDMIRIDGSTPLFAEDSLGSFITDDYGRLQIESFGPDSFLVSLSPDPDTIVAGELIKISKHLHTKNSVKHPVTLPTMYSVHLDNARFANNGSMSFDTVSGSLDEIILDHTEIRYNLLICLEWDASLDYLKGLDSNLRAMSNYLYDVSDGQIRFDTILVYDDMEAWLHADMRIEADNIEWPHCEAGVGGINYPWNAGRNIVMPRRWFGNIDACRNLSASNHPINLVHPNDYRTKIHEFGHYALGFYDEYMFWNPDSSKYTATDALRCNPPHLYNYGFMDRQYSNQGDNSSEMSSSYGYGLAACQNTKQYGLLQVSCWDHLERWVEATTWGPDNIFVPILKPDLGDPDERHNLTGEIFQGPNNDIALPDYDVGKLLVLPRTPQAPAAGIGEILVTVTHSSGGDKADVLLVNNPIDPSPSMIRQGTTSDLGKLWVVGAYGPDCDIEAWKNGSQGTVTAAAQSTSAGTGTWLFGKATLGTSGVSRYGNSFRTSKAEDSLTIELVEVAGDYPMIFDINLEAFSSTLMINTVSPFTAEPSVDLTTDAGINQTYACNASVAGYDVLIPDSLGGSGDFRLWAVDDSGSTFFVPVEYNVTARDTLPGHFEIDGTGGMASVWIDSINTTFELGLVMNSPYPVPVAGLNPGAVQGGRTHTLSLYPSSSLAGTNQITIRYDDADLMIPGGLTGDESTLSIHKWNSTLSQWEIIGGSVNTELNCVEATIHGEGVYAAFTGQIVTGIKDDHIGKTLPYRFELAQNYPNPFNPVTTIEYNLPVREHVNITVFNILGQAVRILVDMEQSAGSHQVTWDGKDGSGRQASTGVYLYRFQTGSHAQTRKMLLLK